MSRSLVRESSTAAGRLAVGLLAVGLLALPLVAPHAASAEALPEARTIVDRFLAAVGAERLLERNSMTSSGTFTIPGQGLEGKLTIYAQAPRRISVETEIPGIGKMRSGFDGAVGWSVDPFTGAQLLADQALDQMRDQANYHALLYRAEDYPSLTVVGRTEFQGTPCWELEVVARSGLKSTHYFAVDTGLLLGMQFIQHSPMGEIPVTTVIKEYRDFDGLKIAAVSEQSMMGMQQIMTVESVSFADLDDAVFALPPDIAALLEAAE
jgi:hypothetical protein